MSEKSFTQSIFRDPMTKSISGQGVKREFSLRILHGEDNHQSINQYKPDDFFVLGSGDHSLLTTEDINLEVLYASTLKEIKYMLGLSNVYE